ncbi:MAG: NUDIX hydrolase [Chloroflexota bacterium]
MYNGILSVQHTIPSRDKPNWVLAGGGVEKGETIPQAGIRELHEEANVTISIGRLLYVRIFYFERPIVEFYPLAQIESGTPSLGYDPETSSENQILTDIRVISFDELEQNESLTFYPIFMRQRLQRDLQHPPTKALYVGTTP